MEAGEEVQAEDLVVAKRESPAPEPMGEPEPPSPSSRDAEPPPPPPPQPHPTPPEGPGEMEGQETETQPEEASDSTWSGPDELEPVLQDNGQQSVRARQGLAAGISWGPFPGSVHHEASSPQQGQPSPPLTLQLEDETCWLRTLPRAKTEAEVNTLVYRKDGALWCKITRPVPAGGPLTVHLSAEPPSAPSPLRKREPEEAKGQAPAPTPSDIQLLPQQAGMASILATAVVNKDIFPCKDCGIWYRSERNLQAHLLYYCASRQGAGSPAPAPAEEKPKEAYPNERVCPFPQCRKSCPSASSLEIHMRSHSGERPFVCLICLSAFTTKANCERHLKVHTDTLSGVCHSCGFISTTRDILCSHLVTSHMTCQPGCKGEPCSPGAGYPAAKAPADGLASFPQHPALHGPLAPADLTPTGFPGLERKEALNGEACVATQNGGEPPAVAPRIKVEAEEEPEAAPTLPRAPSRTPSPPRSPPPVQVKAERSSPSPVCSPAPGDLGAPAGPLFLPQFVFGADAGPQASEILAKMSELVHSRLKQGQGAPGLFAGTPTPKGATCFECEITFNNINNYYVHKRLYCSGRHLAEDAPGARRAKAHSLSPGPQPRTPPAHTDKGAQATGKGPLAPAPNSNQRYCRLCNIKFSSLSTFIAHKKYYCSSHAAEHVK
ncbi:zinc finger protein ZFPM1 [Echinops telfairi]|uniref:Zinc finger protein ZFPM1 n=1 Tax=Echinops telfairi TaxID=9371 RepID=A0ABM0IPK0_ECHTE|nr:zinc finger protein ZFPM1 [Echinops telfairi]